MLWQCLDKSKALISLLLLSLLSAAELISFAFKPLFFRRYSLISHFLSLSFSLHPRFSSLSPSISHGFPLSFLIVLQSTKSRLVSLSHYLFTLYHFNFWIDFLLCFFFACVHFTFISISSTRFHGCLRSFLSYFSLLFTSRFISFV